jgi:prepilin-type N-terminal cleavage/methylation domain-containing protein
MKNPACRHGFTIIEMLLSVVIVSLLTGLLFTILFQTNRAVRTVDRIVDGHSKVIFVNQLMMHDLAGAYIPLHYIWQQREEKASQSKTNAQEKKQEEAAKSAAEQSTAQNKAQIPRLTKIFYGDAHDAMMRELTFITTNPLPSYWDGKIGKPKPRIVRVTYRLQQDEQRARERPLYILVREESFDLMYPEQVIQNQERKHAYEVLHGIRRMSATYSVMIPAESKGGAPATSDERQLYTSQLWNVELDGGNPALIKHAIVLPQLVKIDLVIEEATHEESYSFTVAVQALGVDQQPQTPSTPVPSTPAEQKNTRESTAPQSIENTPSNTTSTKVDTQTTSQVSQQTSQPPTFLTDNSTQQPVQGAL